MLIPNDIKAYIKKYVADETKYLLDLIKELKECIKELKIELEILREGENI